MTPSICRMVIYTPKAALPGQPPQVIPAMIVGVYRKTPTLSSEVVVKALDGIGEEGLNEVDLHLFGPLPPAHDVILTKVPFSEKQMEIGTWTWPARV